MFVQNLNLLEVMYQYPSAAKIVKVEGGYQVFETITDYVTWKNQK